MVSIKEVQASNSKLANTSPTAVFIGGTSGIGLSTIRQLLQKTASPTIYIIGRSENAFQAKLDDLKTLNSSAKLIFLQGEVSLLKDVSRMMSTIESQETKLDLLWLSAGYLSFAAREATSEGLTKHVVVGYYERMLAIHLLLPLLNAAPAARVVSVLAAGREGAINTEDFGLTQDANYSLLASANQQAAMMSLSLEQLSLANPKVVFIHIYPGAVDTGILDRLFGTLSGGWFAPLGWLMSWTFVPLASYFFMTAEEAGARGLYVSTSTVYASGNQGFYRLGPDGEPSAVVKSLEKQREEGLGPRVWEHTVGVFDKVLA